MPEVTESERKELLRLGFEESPGLDMWSLETDEKDGGHDIHLHHNSDGTVRLEVGKVAVPGIPSMDCEVWRDFPTATQAIAHIRTLRGCLESASKLIDPSAVAAKADRMAQTLTAIMATVDLDDAELARITRKAVAAYAKGAES